MANQRSGTPQDPEPANGSESAVFYGAKGGVFALVDSHPWSGLWLPKLRAGVSIRGPQRHARFCGRAPRLGRGWLRSQTSRSSPGPVRWLACDLAELLHPVCAKRKDGVCDAGHVIQEGGAISFKEPSVALQGFYARPFVLGSNARARIFCGPRTESPCRSRRWRCSASLARTWLVRSWAHSF
jgi:hypothetical protein